jgi:flagellar motor protein MotB
MAKPGGDLRQGSLFRSFLAIQESQRQEAAEAQRQAKNLALFNTAKTEFQTAFDTAKAANLERFEEVKAGFSDIISGREGAGPELQTFDASQFAGLGNQARRDVRQTFKNVKAANIQQLVDSGLVGTSQVGAVTAGTARGEASEISRVDESLRREQIGITTGIDRFNVGQKTDFARRLEDLKTGRLAFIERREDIFPDQNALLQLAQSIGQA